MNKIFLIIKREYLTRVRKRSFIIMTILGPLLMAATFVIPIYLATRSNDVKIVAVLDESGIFQGKFKDNDETQFHYLVSDLATAKSNFSKNEDYVLLYIPKTEVTLPTNAILYSEKSVSINVISYIRNVMSRQVEELKLQARLKDLQSDDKAPIAVDDILRSIKTSVDINTMKIGDDGKESKSYTEINMILGMFSGLLIYFFIFMFGAQVMRGVIEEKTSRIVEVIISSVKPFQLMMGKIIGVGLVGLTQFLLWVVLTFTIVTAVTTTLTHANPKKSVAEQVMQPQKALTPESIKNQPITQSEDNGELNQVMGAIQSINFPVMIGSFIFFFLVGYLLYAALFAAIGGAVDSEADTQQFMFPITIPLILSIIMAQYIIRDPDGPIAFWLSMIPLTSPVIMMIRIPFGVAYYEVALSMIFLLAGFIGTTWLAGKIYRTGILMYGKKISYRELWRWIRYKN